MRKSVREVNKFEFKSRLTLHMECNLNQNYILYIINQVQEKGSINN